MAIVAGMDFGTLSARVSLFDDEKGRLASASVEYELIRKSSDPDWATQRPVDQIAAMEKALKRAIEIAEIDGKQIDAIAIDTTGSTVVPVNKHLEPIDDYYMWCDHRAKLEAAEITEKAREIDLENLKWCGGSYSSEWGLAKVLHWLRHNPGKRKDFASAFENCDLLAAMLAGKHSPSQVKRSICAAGHKWMVHEHLGGLPAKDFLNSVDPLLGNVRDKLTGTYATSFEMAGFLSIEWARRLGMRPDIPIPVGALDAHWDAVGAGIREGDVVNVVGTSTCIMGIAREIGLVPGVSGVVHGSIHPEYYGIEAGLAAVGDVFDAIARRSGKTIAELSNSINLLGAGQTGLLRLPWDNGDRNVLSNPDLSGITLGWTLTSTAQDELFAAIEGTAMHTRIVIERMMEHGVKVHRIINGGGIPQKNPALNQIYADVLGKTILVPEQEVTSLGSAIFAFMAIGAFDTLEQAQLNLCPSYVEIKPRPGQIAVYNKLYPIFKNVYEVFGGQREASLDAVLSGLRRLAAEVKQK